MPEAHFSNVGAILAPKFGFLVFVFLEVSKVARGPFFKFGDNFSAEIRIVSCFCVFGGEEGCTRPIFQFLEQF